MPAKRNQRPRGTGSIRERNGRLYTKFYVRGERIERVVGPATMNKTEREERLREIAAELAVQRPVAERHKTIGAVAAEHLAGRRIAGTKANTLANYARDAKLHYVPFLTGPLHQITDADIERYVVRKLDEGLAPKTVRNHLNHLNAIFRLAIKKGWYSGSNPVQGVDRPADPAASQEIRFLTVEQLDELLRVGAEGADRNVHSIRSLERGTKIRQLREKGLDWDTIGVAMDCSPATAIYLSRCTGDDVERNLLALTDRVLWLTAAMTGIRQGELLSLRWRHVDWTAQTIRVHKNTSPEGTPKSEGSFRAVPMAERVARELELHFQASEFQGDDDLVFCHPVTGTRLDRSEVTRRLQRALKRAKLPDLTFHELRHTFGTTMAANPNVTMRDLQEWLGHADIKTTQIYTHWRGRPHQASLVDEAFASPVPSPKQDTTGHNSDPRNPVNTGVQG